MDKNNLINNSWILDQLAVYQAANSDYQTIKDNFIIRTTEFNIIVDALLQKKADDPLQHELIIGRRGSGKSTLLKRIEAEIIENQELKKKYIQVNLAEEQAGIYRLFDLWEQLIFELKNQHHFDIAIPNYDDFNDNQAYTRKLFDIINEWCKCSKKRVVLLLDNFDRIIENFTDDGNLLRETLINYDSVQIIAASTRMDEHFWRYDMPFYDFFRTHKLEALSREEMCLLLTHWSSLLNADSLKEFISKNPGKIENIRILTDGLPRTMQFFIQMVWHNPETDIYDYLKKTMDNVSPLYQERLNSLTPQLRKIVYEMAFIWEACATKQLVEKVKMESKLVSANLKILVNKGIVDKLETQKKQHLYRISERFFNMWLIITQGNPEQKRKAKWLSIFLENWYDANEIKIMANAHISRLKSGQTNWKCALLLSKGLSQSKYLSVIERDDIIELTERLKDNTIDNSIVELPEKFFNILNKIQKLIIKKNFAKAIEIAEAIENEEDGFKFYVLAEIYASQNKYIEAEKYYLKAEDKGLLGVFNNLAYLYENHGKIIEAERYYLKAIENGEVIAINNLAVLYAKQKQYIKAESCYIKAIENGEVNALNNIAVLYYDTNKMNKAALDYINQACEKEEKNAFKETQIIIEIWNGIFNNVEERAKEIVASGEELVIKDLIFDLLVQQQKGIVLNLFEDEKLGKELQEKFTILYYVTRILNKVPDNNLLLKIPPELQSTIDDVLHTIVTKQKFYGY